MLLNFKKLKDGHKLLGVIKQVNEFDLVVSLPSHLTGFVSFEQVSANFSERFETAAAEDADDSAKALPLLSGIYKAGEVVVCSISKVEQKPKKRLELSLKPSDFNTGIDLATDACYGTVLAAEIVSVEDRGYEVSFGVEGFVGFLPTTSVASPLKTGQSIPVWVAKVGKQGSRLLQVSAKLDECPSMKDASVPALRPGSVLNTEIVSLSADGHFITVSFAGVEGRIDLTQLPGRIGYKRAKDLDLSEHLKAGQKLKARMIWADTEEKKFILGAKEELIALLFGTTEESGVRLGETIEACQVLRIDAKNGVLLDIPGATVPAYVHISQLTDEHLEKISSSTGWKVGSRHTCRMIDFDPFCGLLVGSTKPSALKEAFVRIDEIQPGQLVRGTVSRVESYGLLVQITDHIRAICPSSHLTETQSTDATRKVAPGTKYRFRVVDVDPKTRRVTLTRKTGLVASDLPSLCSLSDARIGAYHDGWIGAIRDFGLIVRFYNGVKGLIPVAEISDEFVQRPQDSFFPGQVIRCRVSKCCPEKNELNLSLRKTTDAKAKPADFKKAVSDKKKPAAAADNDSDSDKKMPIAADNDNDKNLETESDKNVKPAKADKKRAAPMTKVEEEPVGKKSKPVAQPTEMTLDDLVGEDDEDSSKLMVEEAAPSKPKRNTAPTENLPSLREICDEFEKRLIGQPNSSLLWIQYMSALLRASELEAARQVAERALTTIRFRDVQEKLNVWIAFMNLERAAGTPETLRKVFERACVYNEPKHVHIQLAKILEETRSGDDDEEALDLHKVMCKKFSQSCKVWVGQMIHLYTLRKDVGAARKLLPQALKSLAKRKHVKITCKAAQLEYKYGSIERARTIFEGILANAPKRVDIWSVYLTMEENRLKSSPTPAQSDIDFCRRLLERIVHLRMSSKKAKFFFKRFLDFEKAHGSEEGVEHVKELARAYVESHQ